MKSETRSFYVRAVERTVDAIVGQLDAALDLTALAKLAALSPYHFHRIFRGMVGETPLELHRRLRMERAAWALATTERAVTEVAFDAGYETHEAFSRAFRARYGLSPSRFRQSAPQDPACGAALQIALTARNGVHYGPELGSMPLALALDDPQGGHDMDVEIKTLDPMRAAAVRHNGPYNQIGHAFERLGAIAGPAGLFGPDAAMIAVYYDDPEGTAPDALRSDAAIVVPPGRDLPDGVSELRVPAGRYAVTTHVGSYKGLGGAWSAFMGQWLPQSGERLADSVCFELYRNTPMQVPEQELRTDLYIPLQ